MYRQKTFYSNSIKFNYSKPYQWKAKKNLYLPKKIIFLKSLTRCPKMTTNNSLLKNHRINKIIKIFSKILKKSLLFKTNQWLLTKKNETIMNQPNSWKKIFFQIKRIWCKDFSLNKITKGIEGVLIKNNFSKNQLVESIPNRIFKRNSRPTILLKK